MVLKKYLLSPRLQMSSFQLVPRWMSTGSNLIIWSSKSSESKAADLKAPTILLMGHAGAKRHQLEKYERLYADLG